MRVINALLLFAAIASCSTKEFRAEEAVCAAEWVEKIPPVYKQIAVERTRATQVPTGNVTCQTQGTGNTATTNCIQEMRTEYIPYTAIETVDIRKTARDQQISMCTVAACNSGYGNSECKPAA